MSIRTTVTLDEDVIERVREESRTRGSSFRDTLNNLLRLGISASHASPARPAFRIKPVHMGVKPGLNYDDVESLLAYGEGEFHK